MQSLWLITILAAGILAPGVQAQQWHTVRSPAPGKAQVIGSYTAGCIQGAAALPATGTGFATLRRSRRRFFGHPTLIQYIQDVGQLVQARNLGTLTIGDLGQPRGGPTPSGHRSHQSGLDVDVWFWLAPSAQALTRQERETFHPPSMLTPTRDALAPQQWSTQHGHLLALAAEFPIVERMFVNPVIKRALCKEQPGAAWLRKIRPWWGHHAHFHVRLRCPEGQTACVNQPPPPPGDGCDASLAWWFSDAARHPKKRAGKGPAALPAACAAILRQ